MTPPSTRAAQVEHAMRQLLRDHDLPEPDAVIDEGDELLLLWCDHKLALVVELDAAA
jgi:hypothetical protein